MKIFAFIPARHKSARFPGKPVARIAGKPMIQHVYERAVSCHEISGVYVATDDERISTCVKGFGGRAVMTEISHHSGTDRIAEAALIMGLENDDIIVNIQGDQHSIREINSIEEFMESPFSVMESATDF